VGVCGSRHRGNDHPGASEDMGCLLSIIIGSIRCARGEASEAAAALEAVQLLHLAPDRDVGAVLPLLDRLCAMLTRLAGLGHGRTGPR